MDGGGGGPDVLSVFITGTDWNSHLRPRHSFLQRLLFRKTGGLHYGAWVNKSAKEKPEKQESLETREESPRPGRIMVAKGAEAP